MGSTVTRQRFREAERRLQTIARQIEGQLPEVIVFALTIFTAGEAGYAGYVSNAARADMVKALRECADTLEAKADSPPGSNVERH